MCIHRKEVCKICRCPIQDTIVLCNDALNMMSLRSTPMGSARRILPYSSENTSMITSMFPHAIPTVERGSSMCRSHYNIAQTNSSIMSYEQYRASKDSWMNM